MRLARKLAVCLALGSMPGFALAADASTGAASPLSPDESRPIDETEKRLPQGWYAGIDTSMGRIVAMLHPEQTPQAVAHFTALAEGRLEWTDSVTGETRANRYYDGLTVHAAAAGRRFETGDPYGTGRGSPAIYLPLETGPIDFSQPWKLGMTRAPLGRISGAQFFITASGQPMLSPRHPCFGTVVQGKDVVFRITSVKTYSNGKPIEPVSLERVRIFAVGDPAPLPEPEPYQPETLRLRVRDELRQD